MNDNQKGNICSEISITKYDGKPKVVDTKKIIEYPLPGATLVHEMAIVSNKMLVISQQSSSTLLKVQLNDKGEPTQV